MQEENEPGYSRSVSTESSSEIFEFYRDRSIFFTGATGFLGKTLLEKLLRSCNSLKAIYVLLRGKDSQEPRQRLDDLFSSQIFDKVKALHSNAITKVVPINGDITLPGLGINDSDRAVLIKNVSVVFHSAATIRFDEPLKKSIVINLVGTKNVMDLCKKMKQLVALVHVSTAYSYCNKEEIDEVVYPEPVPPLKVIEATEWMSEELLDCIMPHLISGRPTTYHYTKALAESLLVHDGGNLPAAIVRPSIVTAAWKEPIPGYIDNLNGPSGYIAYMAKGHLRTMLVYRNSTVDIIPVDIVVNTLISVAWYTATVRPNSTMIYHCTTGCLNRIKWGDIERMAQSLVVRHPSIEVLRYPGGSFKSNRFLNEVSIQLEHSLPAYLLDFLAWITGFKTEFVQMTKRLQRVNGYLQFFTTREWIFHCDNILMLIDHMSEKDKKIFNIDVRPIEWPTYMEDYVLGIRRFALKEDESTLPAARRKLRRIYYLTQIGQLMMVLGLLRLLVSRLTFARNLWWSLVTLGLRLGRFIPG